MLTPLARESRSTAFHAKRTFARGTTLVPTDASDESDVSAAGDGGDDGDAPRRIAQVHAPAGGRPVAGSNPVAPISDRHCEEPRNPALKAGRSHRHRRNQAFLSKLSQDLRIATLKDRQLRRIGRRQWEAEDDPSAPSTRCSTGLSPLLANGAANSRPEPQRSAGTIPTGLLGVRYTSAGIGTAIGIPAFGWLTDLSESFKPAIAACLVLGAAAYAMVLSIDATAWTRTRERASRCLKPVESTSNRRLVTEGR